MPATRARAERRRASRLLPGPRLRLALLAVVVVGLYLTLVTTDLVRPAVVRAWVAPWGAAAPLLFVPVSAALGLLLVPGPVLAGASGLLFGPTVGTPVTLATSVLSAIGAQLMGRMIGREGVERISGRRIEALTNWLGEHGFRGRRGGPAGPAAPRLPDLVRSRSDRRAHVQMAAGTAVGAAPRAFAYTRPGGIAREPHLTARARGRLGHRGGQRRGRRRRSPPRPTLAQRARGVGRG
jgi:hypothetical protein